MSRGDQASAPGEISVTYRTLHDETEVEPWISLLAEVFGGFGIPRGYFGKHWFSDPYRDPAAVFVAEADGRLVGSCRVFNRTINFGGHTFRLGGIGEVAVLADYRMRGLATSLIEKALAYMAAAEFDIAALHAMSTAASVYRRLDFVAASMPVSTLTAENDAFGANATPFNEMLKRILKESTYEKNLDDDATYEKWAAVYASFSSGLDGSIVRSSEYWKCWVKYPAEGYSWNGDGTERCARAWEVVGEGGSTTAYIIVKSQGTASEVAEAAVSTLRDQIATTGEAKEPKTSLFLLDFACTSSPGSPKAVQWLRYLAGVALKEFDAESITVPTVFLTQANDSGASDRAIPGSVAPASSWMYKAVSCTATSVVASLVAGAGQPHCVLPVDEY